jgi:type VI secretion system protein ImpK
MPNAHVPTRSGAAPVSASGANTLAMVLQEVLTAAARLRTRRQEAEDPVAFRRTAKRALLDARQAALDIGYSQRDADLALYAVTALIDEAVLNSGQAAFDRWAKQPLGNDLFGAHLGGENFFTYIDQLLAAEGSGRVADLLEVYQLCILLGFRGKFASGSAGQLQRVREAIEKRIRAIRGDPGELAPEWRSPTSGSPVLRGDPWLRVIVRGAGALALVAGTLFVGYYFWLDARATSLRTELTTSVR